MASFLAAKPDTPLWGWGLLLIAVGLAHLLYWSLRGRSEWEAAQDLERQQKRVWLTHSSGESSPTADIGPSA